VKEKSLGVAQHGPPPVKFRIISAPVVARKGKNDRMAS
jgi:hypothetical protein